MAQVKPKTRFDAHADYKIGSRSNAANPFRKTDLIAAQSMGADGKTEGNHCVGYVDDVIKDVVKAGGGDAGTVVLDSVNQLTIGTFNAGGGNLATDGTIAASAHSNLDFISVAGWDGIKVNFVGYLCFYTSAADAGFIGSRITTSVGLETPIPPSATHMRISLNKATLAACLAAYYYVSFYRVKHDLNWLSLSAANLSGSVNTHEASANLIDDTEFYETAGFANYKHSTTPGTFVANAGYKVSKLIDITGADSLKILNLHLYSLCFYDASAAAANPATGFENFTTGCIGGAGAPTSTDLYDQIVTVPTNAVYCRVSVRANSSTRTYVKPWSAHKDLASLKAAVSGKKVMPSLWVPRSQVEVPNNHLYGKKIVWLGTSITSGTYCNNKPYSVLVGDILGASIYNYSMDGNRLHLVSDGEGGLEVERTSPVSGAFAGTEAENLASYPEWDDGGTEGVLNEAYRPRSYERALLGQSADLYIFDKESNNSAGEATTDWDDFDVAAWGYGSGTFASHRGTYLGALLYLLNELWTENPLARVVFIGWQGNASATIRAQTQTLCAALNLPYIDMWKKMQYNIVLNKGLLTASGDGIHPNATWSAMIAPGLANELLLV